MFLYNKKKATIKRILPPVEHQGTIIYLLWSDTLGKKTEERQFRAQDGKTVQTRFTYTSTCTTYEKTTI